MVHCSSSTYLSSYLYHEPLREFKNIENLPRSRPSGVKTLPLSDAMGQIPATEALGCRWVPIRRLRKTSVIVVGHTYRVIYITSPSQKHKNIKICPERPPGAKTLPLSDEMGQIPATEALGCRWVPIRRLRKTSVIVVGHTYRVIHITSLAQNLQMLKICPDRDPREPKPFC